MKSPLKLPSKEFKSARFLKSIIPMGKIVHSYLFFHGAPEFQLARDKRFVVGHTNRYVVYEFWRCAIEDPRRIATIAARLYPVKDEPVWNILQENWASYKDPFIRSALFFLLNRCSDSGLIASGKLQNENFHPISLSYLNNFKAPNFHLQLDEGDNFLDKADEIKNCDFFLVPAGRYGLDLLTEGMPTGLEETRVNHRRLEKWFKKNSRNCIIVYFKHNQIFKKYKDYNMTMIDKFGRVTSDKDRCEEIVIVNF